MIRYTIPKLTLFSSTLPTQQILNEKDFLLYFYQQEQIIKNSRFITTIAHCDTIDSARLAIDYIQKKYSDATHNCWAFQVDKPKSTSHIGYSDDGEPHGTAGKPMLTQLLYTEIGEIATIVTRYYGGVKLGTGGLVRAYQGSVALALESLPQTQKIQKKYIQITLDYSHAGFLHRMREEYEVTIEKETFHADIVYTLSLPEDRLSSFLESLQQLTDGTFLFEEI